MYSQEVSNKKPLFILVKQVLKGAFSNQSFERIFLRLFLFFSICLKVGITPFSKRSITDL